MALRNLRIDPDEILRKKARFVPEITEGVQTLIQDLRDTMRHYNGVGLAAPQVGILKRVVVIDDEEEEASYDMINPEVVLEEGTQSGDEACLSVPKIIGTVQRPETLAVAFTDLSGQERRVTVKGRLAIILAHELDHLEGVLYKDRATPGTIRENTGDEQAINRRRRRKV